MNILSGKLPFLLGAVFAGSVVLASSVQAETSKLIIESGDSAQSRQHASMEKSNGMIPECYGKSE